MSDLQKTKLETAMLRRKKPWNDRNKEEALSKDRSTITEQLNAKNTCKNTFSGQ